MCSVGLDDASVGEDDFEVDDVVSSKTTLIGVVGETTSQEESSDTDCTNGTSLDASVKCVHCAVHTKPSCTWAN